jgi:hypothetical protein
VFRVGLVLDGNFTEFNITTFDARLAALLGVGMDAITTVARKGSVITESDVVVENATDVRQTAEATFLADEATLTAALALPGFSVRNMTISTSSLPSSDKDSAMSWATWAIPGVAIGMLLVIVCVSQGGALYQRLSAIESPFGVGVDFGAHVPKTGRIHDQLDSLQRSGVLAVPFAVK